MSQYDNLIKWCRVFLGNQSFTNYSGEDKAYSLLFPMEKVFESYVAKCIIRSRLFKDFQIHLQHRKHYLLESNRRFRLIPDILVLGIAKTLHFIQSDKGHGGEAHNHGLEMVNLSSCFVLLRYEIYNYNNKKINLWRELMLKVDNVTKKYGKVLAVDQMSFEIEDGEIAVLLGPNGAGKSTIIKCIAGLLQHKGIISIKGHMNKGIEAKKILGYVPETAALFDALTVEEHIHFIAKAYGLKGYEEYAHELFDRFDLDDKTEKLGKELSKGMQQKLSICCGVITRPNVILFDEPMIGLDPKAIKELKKLFMELKEQGCSVLISTHIIDTIKEVWDRILIMDKGNIVSSIPRDETMTEAEIEERFFAVTGGIE